MSGGKAVRFKYVHTIHVVQFEIAAEIYSRPVGAHNTFNDIDNGGYDKRVENGDNSIPVFDTGQK